MEIKSIIEYANGFMTQAFAFCGEDGMEKCVSTLEKQLKQISNL